MLVDFALQPKGIRQTLLKERFMHAISCRRERSSLVGTNLCYTVTFGGGMDYRVCVNSFRNLYVSSREVGVELLLLAAIMLPDQWSMAILVVIIALALPVQLMPNHLL